MFKVILKNLPPSEDFQPSSNLELRQAEIPEEDWEEVKTQQRENAWLRYWKFYRNIVSAPKGDAKSMSQDEVETCGDVASKLRAAKDAEFVMLEKAEYKMLSDKVKEAKYTVADPRLSEVFSDLKKTEEIKDEPVTSVEANTE